MEHKIMETEEIAILGEVFADPEVEVDTAATRGLHSVHSPIQQGCC